MPRRHSVARAGLALALLLGGASCRRSPEPPGPVRGGKWKPAVAERTAQVEALPYSRGYVRPTGGRTGVVLYDPSRTTPGVNLLTSGNEAAAIAFAMDGRELHRWSMPLATAFPELGGDREAAKLDYWRRVALLPDGSLLAIYEGIGVVKVDRASRLVWARRGNFHHDLEVAPDGSIWVLDREGKILPRINPTEGVLEDFATRLGADGSVLEHVSILRAFETSPFADTLASMPKKGDILHTNTLEILDGSWAPTRPPFRTGRLLLSELQTSTLAVLDPVSGRIVWALRGAWRKQHQPTVLANGHLLLFDNTGLDRDHSRVLEVDPTNGAIVWSYGGTPEEPLASRTLGSVQRLANGNTLITESERGRALEVTPNKDIVWEYRSPYRTGDHDELVAALLEVIRLPETAAF